MKKLSIFIVSLLFLNIQPTHAVETLPQPFFNYLNSKYLGDPGVILIDKASGEVIYESGSTKARTPASVLKLTSTAAIALTLDANTVFKTAIYKTEKRGVFVIWGENDPWITSNAKYRDANKRAYMPKLIKAAFASDKKLKKITLIYKGVNNSDIYYAKKALKRRASVAYKPLSKNIEVESLITEKLSQVESPPLSKMIRFALLYSDNVLSQRLAMLATGKNGYPLNKEGLNDMAHEKLTTLGIDTKGMKLVDGSGLGGSNRISAVTVSKLLLKIRSEPQLKVVYDSLPVGGESGTLIGRYHTTAPQAVGIVKAKTGSTRHTVSLAGYTSAGEKEYVFVVIADGVGRTKRSQNAARSAIDRMLGTITKPVVIGLTPPTVENNPVVIAQ
ncbi:D-alanyl-D-alanine carboxypeptidase / D-alanyl-D-alanine-endopeptidase (penicillin-binding protein 4) [Candidatus Nanopelagicus abundans]|uniref:D-alanyl-D-alanine carboxypeptidase / D-alanyl-D-alanine-endopeptidase (Penicillin-binding protein 4) n=1 Tax=Candidatus Nanopelagicus abundans TaxID=1884916 RepID=A0A249L2Q8_9ACTN|nr:D-alanyl-D-alanine carboxypeptidase [Candidatus Nanopelagicus abundans]ASY23353.1 D-alanyl-D-alanine carboxypeptidase / D-alanyl-D-alanine-endopeptidase (penicillin-binding protein 4) [Candidatus Nanopelagicus abundans]